MKKAIIIFIVGSMFLLSLLIWALNTRFTGNMGEILMVATLLIVGSYGIYVAFGRVKSSIRKEPFEDELSKRIMVKASSLTFYLSFYLWLFIMYISDKTKLETHTLIGAGILGMAIVFLLTWLGVRIYGLKNE